MSTLTTATAALLMEPRLPARGLSSNPNCFCPKRLRSLEQGGRHPARFSYELVELFEASSQPHLTAELEHVAHVHWGRSAALLFVTLFLTQDSESLREHQLGVLHIK